MQAYLINGMKFRSRSAVVKYFRSLFGDRNIPLYGKTIISYGPETELFQSFRALMDVDGWMNQLTRFEVEHGRSGCALVAVRGPFLCRLKWQDFIEYHRLDEAA